MIVVCYHDMKDIKKVLPADRSTFFNGFLPLRFKGTHCAEVCVPYLLIDTNLCVDYILTK